LEWLNPLKQPIAARGERLLAVEKILIELDRRLFAAEKNHDALEYDLDSVEKWAVAKTGYKPCKLASAEDGGFVVQQ
jgi:hypothetical protein